MMPQGAFGGTRATYVAVSAVSILVLALLTSIWHSDVSGSIALLGLLSVYLSSTELLLLFTILAPLSIIVDIIRLSGKSPAQSARGFLVFLSLAEMLAKGAGAVFGWSLHRSISSGEGGAYQSMTLGGTSGMAANPSNPAGVGMTPPSYDSTAPGGGSDANPFGAYAPPRNEGHNGSTNTYQPFPTTQPAHL